MRWKRVLLLLVVSGVLSGCGETPPPAPLSESVPVVAPAPPEKSFAEQLAAVRAGDASQIRVHTSEVTAEELEQLRDGCDGLTVLQLRGTFDDAALEVLPHLVSLRQLVLDAPVGDAGLQLIGRCSSLEIVNLPRALCSDAGLAALRELPLLTLLRIGSPLLTNAGMEHLAEMPNLRFVHLIGAPITDEGLEPLKRVRLLESFYIDGSRCTDAGLSCLLKAAPGLHLHVNQLHLPGDEHRYGPVDAPAPP